MFAHHGYFFSQIVKAIVSQAADDVNNTLILFGEHNTMLVQDACNYSFPSKVYQVNRVILTLGILYVLSIKLCQAHRLIFSVLFNSLLRLFSVV